MAREQRYADCDMGPLHQIEESGHKEWLTLPSEHVSLAGGAKSTASWRSNAAPATRAACYNDAQRRPRSTWAYALYALPIEASSAAACSHCSRPGCAPRVCSFGLAEGERFLLCSRTQPAPCFPRIFVVPLRRATPSFDCDDLRAGRVDVGLRCVNAALFRSQSLRQNTQVVLCFGDYSSGVEGGGGSGSNGSGGNRSSERLVEVHGAMVRDLRPDERSLAPAARHRRRAGRAPRRRRDAARGPERGRPTDDGLLGRRSRGEHRGFRSREGGLLDAVRRSLDGENQRRCPPFAPPQPHWRPHQRALFGTATTPPGGVVVLGDDRGLSDAEEREVERLAAARGGGVAASRWARTCSPPIRCDRAPPPRWRAPLCAVGHGCSCGAAAARGSGRGRRLARAWRGSR